MCRNIIDSRIFANSTALKIYVWCLASASYKKHFVPIKAGRGETTVELLPFQFIFRRASAEKKLKIDGITIYKWMKKLETAEFGKALKMEGNNQYTIVTINNQTICTSEITTKEQQKNNEGTTKEQQNSADSTPVRKSDTLIKDNTVYTVKEYFKDKNLNLIFNQFLEQRQQIEKKPVSDLRISKYKILLELYGRGNIENEKIYIQNAIAGEFKTIMFLKDL
jgi:hypothetical protein